MAVRQQNYDAFIASRPTFQQMLDKAKQERDIVDKTLTLARLKYLYLDYQPYRILSSLFNKGTAGNTVIDADTKTRYGWTRWDEIRQRIDNVDSWLRSPMQGTANAVLKEIMVDIPDSVDYELDAWNRNLSVLKTKTAQFAQNTLDSAGSALLTVGLPVLLVYGAMTAYNVTKKK
jgi:hypothetical protein